MIYREVGSRCNGTGSWQYLRRAHTAGGSFSWWNKLWRKYLMKNKLDALAQFDVSLTHCKVVLKTRFRYSASNHNSSCTFLIAADYWLAQALQNIAEAEAIILQNNCMDYLNTQTPLNKPVLSHIKFSTNCCWLNFVFTVKTSFS